MILSSIEKSGDKVLGFVSIDLSPLLTGLQQISGWYNIIDTTGNIQGQLKIRIVPQEDLSQLKCIKYNSQQCQSKLDSNCTISTNNVCVTPLIMNDLSARTVNFSSVYFLFFPFMTKFSRLRKVQQV